MEEVEYPVKEILKSCINAHITGVHEEDDAVFLYLSDGQRISITVIPDGGFLIDVQLGLLH